MELSTNKDQGPGLDSGIPTTHVVTDNMGGAESMCSNYVIRVLLNMVCQQSPQKLH